MSRKYQCTDAQRYAVYTIHGEKCYLCSRPIDLESMQVDHLIPESLLEDPEKLAAILAFLGRPSDFGINTFANWMPACAPCNNRKRDRVFDPTPQIQLLLQQAEDRSKHAEELAKTVINNQQISKALNLLARAHQSRGLPKSAIEKLTLFHLQHRNQESAALPIQLTKEDAIGLKVVFSGGPRDGGVALSGYDLPPEEAFLLLSSAAPIAQMIDAAFARPGCFFIWKEPCKELVELGRLRGWTDDDFKSQMKYHLYSVNSHEWGDSTLVLKAEYEGME